MTNPARQHRRPFLMPIWLLSLAAIAGAAVPMLAAWWLFTADSTTVIVIRHAEKVKDAGTDPPLSEAGTARAELLARMFGDAGSSHHIDAIYTSPALRNRMTAAPLAARLNITPVIAPADEPRSLARRVLHEAHGGRILVVGHADTVPAIVQALTGAKNIAPIGADEYGTMYFISVPRVGRANYLRLNF